MLVLPESVARHAGWHGWNSDWRVATRRTRGRAGTLWPYPHIIVRMAIARSGDAGGCIIPMRIPPRAVALVDDDPYLLRALERVLLACGYRVQSYTSAEQYLREANAGEISCAVIDINLGAGRLSGLDLGDVIAQSLHATPIVFMTGSDELALCERARDIGCLEFLTKPFLPAKLVAALTRLEGLSGKTV
jgi:CheY-like chemotaxis protein